MSSTKAKAMFLRSTLTGYQVQLAAILAEGSRSQKWQQEQAAKLKVDTLGKCRREVKDLWGQVPGLGADLQGGAFWADLEDARGRLKAARDAADTLDPMRIQNAIAALPSIVSRLNNVVDFDRWYGQATAVERRAAQLAGPEALLRKWGSLDGLGHTFAGLQADYEASLTTPEVQAAVAELDDLDAAAAAALGYTREAATLAGETLSFGVGQGDFAGVLTRVQRGPDGWEQRNPYPHIKGWDPAAEEAEEPEADALAPLPETRSQQAQRVYSGQ